MSTKKAIITGPYGQDFSYLKDLLLSESYEVIGFGRSKENKSPSKDIRIVEGDLSNDLDVENLIKSEKPDELYNLAAQSFVPTSFGNPKIVCDVNATGVARLLMNIKEYCPQCKFFQAGSSELFGNSLTQRLQNEKTPINPKTPYGASKAFAFFLTRNFRDIYNVFACNGILYSHESPLRSDKFVTQKIATSVAKIKLGKLNKIKLGNINARRDWSHAKDFVKAMYLMMQHSKSDDYVIASGQNHSIKDFLKIAFNYVALDWNDYIEIDPHLYRPVEVGNLIGNPNKAKKVLGWKPLISFNNIVEEMVESAMVREKE